MSSSFALKGFTEENKSQLITLKDSIEEVLNQQEKAAIERENQEKIIKGRVSDNEEKIEEEEEDDKKIEENELNPEKEEPLIITKEEELEVKFEENTELIGDNYDKENGLNDALDLNIGQELNESQNGILINKSLKSN